MKSFCNRSILTRVLLSILLTVAASFAHSAGTSGFAAKAQGLTSPYSKGGSIQGGGGGDFSLSSFWMWVGQIKLVLNDENFVQKISAAQQEELKWLMDSKVTKVLSVDSPLYVQDADGKTVPVDAVNIPKEKTILLYKSAWEKKFESGAEVRHLILHEFLGLAKIDDSEFHVSSSYFQPTEKPIPFEWNNVTCSTSGYFLYQTANSYYLGNTFGSIADEHEMKTEFSAPALIGKNSFKDHRRRTKKASLLVPIPLRSEYVPPRPGVSEFKMKIDFSFGDEYQGYGWGAAASKRFQSNSSVQVVAQLISQDPVSKKQKVLAFQSVIEESTNAEGEVAFEFSMLNSELGSLLLNAGIEIQPASDSVAGTNLLNAQNISDLLYDYAKSKGAKNQKEADAVLQKTIFKNAPAVIPVYMSLSCSVSDK